MADTDEANENAKKAICANPLSVESLTELGNLLNNRYVATDMLVDLDASILVTKQAIGAITNDDVKLADCSNTLSYRLQDRFMVTEDNADLEEAIQMARKAVGLTSTRNARHLSNLAASLKTRFSVTGDLKDMEDGVALAKQAVSVTASDDPELPKWLNNLGNHLSNRHLLTGSLEDLEEAINLSRGAAASTSDSTTRALFLNNLSAKLDLKAEVTGNSIDYDEAIGLAKEAITLTPEGHPDQAKWLNNLATHLLEKFDRSWDLNDLQDAINAASRAADLTPNGPTKALYLDTVADGLNRKYDKMGQLTDLEEAIQMTEMALGMLPIHHSKRPQVLSTLSDLFSNRYLRKEMIQDLDRAIELSREAANAKFDNHPYKAIYLDRLAMQLNLRSSISRTDPHLWKDLEESIQLERKSIAITANYRPTWSFKNNLQAMLVIKYGMTKDQAILDECTQLQREALDEIPEGHQYCAEMLTSLGYRLRDNGKETSNLEKASECFLEALQNKNAPAISRVRAGSALLQSCPDKQKAYQAAQVITGLLPQLITRSHETSDKQHAAGSRAGMTCSAAAAALKAERPVFEALQVLELGRGVLAKYSEEMLLGPLQLGQLSTEQAEAYTHLRDELKGSNTPVPPDMSSSFQKHVSGLNKRYDLTTELEELITEIRKLPEFEDLWTAPTEGEMFEAAERGPIVVVNVSRARCDALLIEKHQMRSLALPNIINDLYKFARVGDFGSSKVLEWMWNNITQPVLDALGYSKPPGGCAWPHIWWIPTALLTLFPLHAAGYHRKESSETVIDRVVSSYASSIRAIMRGRQKDLPSSFSSKAIPRALLVGMQHTPESGSLSYANKEIDIVQKLCESAGLDTVQPRPRKQEVCGSLLHCQVFHFAGHGYTDENDPSNSHLRLEDWKEDPFRVADLQRMNLREHAPFLAYLSACGTGQMKRYNLVDESIHLISAYQLAGFRHVIGTLWKVSDQCCVDIARTTYEAMRDLGISDDSVSWGLHRASRELRDKWVKEHKQENRPLTRGCPVVGNDIRNVEADKKNENGRDIVSVEEEPEVGEQLRWAPYVHFGLIKAAPPGSTRLVFVENISPGIIISLGEKLDIDPLFFADYIHVGFENPEESSPPPSLATLPSVIATRDHIHLHCQKVIALEGTDEELKHVPYALKTESNVPRNVRRLVTLPGGRLALSQTCCSFIIRTVGDICICLFLVDPPVTSVIQSLDGGRISKYEASVSHGGFEDFRAPQTFSSFRKLPSSETWDKKSTMENIIHYLQASPPPGLDLKSPSILGIGYYPIYITLPEWNIYTYLTSRCSKYYEYSDQVKTGRMHNEVLVDLQRWRRRSKSSHQKLNILGEVISSHIQRGDDMGVWRGVLKDINSLRDQLHDYSQSLEQMVMVATSLVQLLDSRRSILEAINTKRLTFLALVFVPLAWVSSLFSMSDSYSPGHDLFWVYFATALPVLAVVLLLSALPYSRIAITVESYIERTRKHRMKALGESV
ncbi:hypothetical protein FPHYL_7774 [Fusarium phyllophilum]|uniref:CHAT domain-containing protein n=1 Tax=Fusarium phyllophilum TaxID=47803 RepID=A0A8H5N9X6_9HYPO|nr:hypothetical protein FPHYL_7774 [Fusarium phyllophilum]